MDDIRTSKLVDLVDRKYDLIKKLELISFLILLTGYLVHMKSHSSDIILIVGIVLTAFFLFIQSYKIVEFENYEAYNVLGSIIFVNFINKLYFFSLTVSTTSLLGFVIDFKKGNTLAIIGGTSLIVILILTFFSKMIDKSRIYNVRFYLRILISLLSICILAIERGIIK